MKFALYLEKDSTSDYGVTIPDLPGCFSSGANIEEAMDNAREHPYEDRCLCRT